MRICCLIFFLFLFSACASYKTKYHKSVSKWETDWSEQLPDVTPQYILYGIGDAGYLPDGKMSPALRSIQSMSATDVAPNGVIFLGDNIYPSGMPKKEAENRKDAESRMDAQIEIAKPFGKNAFFIPGNHDWRQDDPQKGVQRQEKYVEKELDNDYFYPDDGCSGPEDFRLSDDVVLLTFDSEWYVQNWDGQVDFNEDCDYKTRFDFMYELTDQIKKACKDKRVIIAMHHPIFTNGSHGGKFPFKDHLFPLRNMHPPRNIPLPVIGSLYPVLRRYAGVREDMYGDKYKEMRKELLKSTDVFDDVIFLSGHEHNMQYIYREDHHHIIAGSGSKITASGMGEGAEFTMMELGFARIIIYDKGEAWVEYYACDETGERLVYARKLADALTSFELSNQDFPPPTKPYVELPIIEEDISRSGFYQFWLGKQYSELYNMPIRARVTNLSIKEGGLVGVKRGGGFQTNSVRLENPKGKEWVMRALRKDPSRLLPDEFSNTVAEEAVDYFLTTAHPLAAFTLPPMAESIGILHTKPELVYIPKQQALGEFNEDHGNTLYLYEDRPGKDRSDRDNFGNSEDIISTDDLIEEMRKNGRNRPNQHDVVRNRLFDMVIGDWDRHDDQWRWAKFEGPEKREIYRPVPRDRDQAYSIFQGTLVSLGRIFSPGIAKFQTFDDKIKRIDYFNFNARYFDRSFLNELNWDDWTTEIEHIQQTLTDSVIHTGVSLMQDDFYEKTGPEIESHLRARRDKLPDFARKYYEFLIKNVDIIASDDDDLIEVMHDKKGVQIRISEIDKNGKIKYQYYDHYFDAKETKEIRIYALDGDDKFKITGKSGRIKVRMLGGTDDDVYEKEGSAGKNFVYDYADDTKVNKSPGLHYRLSDDYQKNTYDRKMFKYNHSFLLPLMGYNPDNGFLLGALFNGTWHGFKKDPYRMSHNLSILYSFETQGFQLNYLGRFIDVVGDWNIRAEGLVQGEFFSNNYFGQGNESVNPSEEPTNEDFDYNRLRNSITTVKLLLEKEVGDQGRFYFGPMVDFREVDYQADRFIATVYDPDDIIYQNIAYAGGKVGFAYENIDDITNPHQGVRIDVSSDYLTDVEGLDVWKIGLNTKISMYRPLDYDEDFIWAHEIGAGFTFGGNSLFYHQQQLGGTSGLRGFRNERFTGTSMLYYNTDIRWRLFEFDSYFAPSTVGIYGGFDVGRVWIKEEDSSTWHTNFGGGLWIDPFEMIVFNFGYFTSGKEQGRFLFSLGFDF